MLHTTALLPTTRMAAILRSPLLSSACSSSSGTSSSLSSSLHFGTVSAFSVAAPVSAAGVLSSAGVTISGGSALSSSTRFSCTAPVAAGVRQLQSFSFAPAPAPARRASTMGTKASSPVSAPTARSVHEFVVKDINGEEVALSKFKGKALLIVNVASACGLTTGNYTELAEVYSHLKDSGLEILAFPCNQFGGQEPGTNAQIKEFACTRFKAEYPIFDKVDVNGPNTAPLYAFLKASKGGGILGDSIKWNFAKFLVDQDGNVVDRYAPTTSPKKIEADIKKLLGV